jgi:hypothetical protein
MSEATRKPQERVQRSQTQKVRNRLLKHKQFLPLSCVDTLMALEGPHDKTVDGVNRLIPPNLSALVLDNSVHTVEGTNYGSKGVGEGARWALKLLGFPRESALGEHLILRITASRTIPHLTLKHGPLHNVNG